MKKIIYFLFIICSLLALLYTLSNPCRTKSCVDFPGDSSWILKETYENTPEVWRGLYQHPDYLVRIARYRVKDEAQATGYTQIHSMQMETLYEKSQSPYPGAVSDTVECQAEYLPVTQTISAENGLDMAVYTAFVNDRLNYGACIDDQITYKGYNTAFYCKNIHQWYNLDIFVSKENLQQDSVYLDLFKKIKCQRPSLNIGRLFP